MAEYYPLLAKAVGSLPNSTPDTRRVVYERARKALIGQLRTLAPPVPEEDIEHESVELDRAIARIETEIAERASVPTGESTAPALAETTGSPVAAPPASRAATVPSQTLPPQTPPPQTPPPQTPPPQTPPPQTPPPRPSPPKTPLAPTLPRPPAPVAPSKPASAFADKPFQPLRSKSPAPKPPVADGVEVASAPVEVVDTKSIDTKSIDTKSIDTKPVDAKPVDPVAPRSVPPPLVMPGGDASLRPPRLDGQRPIAPQPPVAKGPKRRLWIIPVGVGVVAACVAIAAWKLRDRPETLVRAKPADTQTQGDTNKIAERVGGPATTDAPASAPSDTTSGSSSAPAAPATDAKPAGQTAAVASQNPDLPVAHRAALLVESPNDDNKVKTYLGTVVWKLNTLNEGQADAASLAVEADIDLPDDKTKAIVTFQKNTDASLPASHTIKVRFMVQPGSTTGDIKQINVPQMRREDNPSGEALAGVTVPVIQNSFLVGLSPGNAETANLELIRSLQWIDIPILLDSGKIAKLTFEKSESGQRDLSEAIAAWQK